jgi:hypothetical protein
VTSVQTDSTSQSSSSESFCAVTHCAQSTNHVNYVFKPALLFKPLLNPTL